MTSEQRREKREADLQRRLLESAQYRQQKATARSRDIPFKKGMIASGVVAGFGLLFNGTTALTGILCLVALAACSVAVSVHQK